MSDHHASSKEDVPGTTYDTPAGSSGENSDTPRPRSTSVQLPAVNVVQSTPEQVATARHNNATHIQSRSQFNAASGPSSPMTPGNPSMAGPSTGSYFPSQSITPATNVTDPSLRHQKRYSRISSTLQDYPIAEDDVGSDTSLVQEQPPQLPSQPPPPAPPPSHTKPPSLRGPRDNGHERPMSMPSPTFMEPPNQARQRPTRSVYDMNYNASGSLAAGSPDPAHRHSYVERRHSQHDLQNTANGSGRPRNEPRRQRSNGDERYPELAEEGRMSRRSIRILDNNIVPIQEVVQQQGQVAPGDRWPPGTVGSRLEPTLKHANAALKEANRIAKVTSWCLNAAIGAQVVLGALTTGVAAATTGRQTSIATSILGGLSTLAASYLARTRGSGEPETSVMKCSALEQFVRDCEAFLLDHGRDEGESQEMHIARYRKRFEEIQGNDSTAVAEGLVEKHQMRQMQQVPVYHGVANGSAVAPTMTAPPPNALVNH